MHYYQIFIREHQPLFIWLVFLFLLNNWGYTQNLPDTLGYKILSIKKGDRCIVCDIPLKEGTGIALLIKGRRVTIDLEHLDEFLQDKEFYFSKLKPRGALFQESAVLLNTLKSGWFILGCLIVLSLIMGGLSCHLAIKRGYPPISWFFIGFFLNIFGLLWVVLKRERTIQKLPAGWAKIPQTASPVNCPSCGAPNHPGAERCIKCNSRFWPEIETEVKRLKVTE